MLETRNAAGLEAIWSLAGLHWPHMLFSTGNSKVKRPWFWILEYFILWILELKILNLYN